ncbi:hypothetical protein TCON_0258 [Astathelohania contejeani]|uniref:Uncharacterized protein n=1 Tax=Astathelohania contejeani TaxID=164912 RepID=A0ABQ7I2C4_9MICR|nr:hypothetical protein TCON_0258 [Thelohania contejeani]
MAILTEKVNNSLVLYKIKKYEISHYNTLPIQSCDDYYIAPNNKLILLKKEDLTYLINWEGTEINLEMDLYTISYTQTTPIIYYTFSNELYSYTFGDSSKLLITIENSYDKIETTEHSVYLWNENEMIKLDRRCEGSPVVKIEFAGKIKDIVISCDQMVALDQSFNLQLYDLENLKWICGFKAVSDKIVKMIACPTAPLLAIFSDDTVFIIHTIERSILRKQEIPSIEDALFIDKRRILIRTGDNMPRKRLIYNIRSGSISDNLFPDGIEEVKLFEKVDDFKLENEKGIDETLINNLIKSNQELREFVYNMKIDLKREIYKVKEEIEELKDQLSKKD